MDMAGIQAEQDIDFATRVFQDFETAAGLTVRRAQLSGMYNEALRTAMQHVEVHEVDAPDYFNATVDQVPSPDDRPSSFRDSADHMVIYSATKERVNTELRTLQRELSILVVGEAVTVTTVSADPVIEETYVSTGIFGTNQQQFCGFRHRAKGIIRAIDLENNLLSILPRRNTVANMNGGSYKTPVIDTKTGQPIVTIDFRELTFLDIPARRFSRLFPSS